MVDFKQMTNEELALAFVEGNDRAFDFLIGRIKEKLFSYILFVVKDKHMADDVFQDTFLKAIIKLRDGSYTSNGKFMAWMVCIAHNCIMDIYRMQKRNTRVDVGEDNDIETFMDSNSSESSVEMKIVEQQNMKEATLLMNSLPMTQREVVYMRLYQEMSFKEIAESTGMSINTALGRMRYAVINMRKMASDYKIAI